MRLHLPAATNYVANPACVTKWGTDGAGMVFTRETAPPVALPEDLIYCTKLVHTATNLATIYPNGAVKFPVVAGQKYTFSWYCHVSALTGGDLLRIRLLGYIGAAYSSDYAITQVTAVNSSFVRLVYTFTVAAGQDGILPVIYSSDQAGQTMTAYMTGMQFEDGAVATPFFSGDSHDQSLRADTFAWTSTPNASPSTRAASDLHYALGNVSGGTIAFRWVPLWGSADALTFQLLTSDGTILSCVANATQVYFGVFIDGAFRWAYGVIAGDSWLAGSEHTFVATWGDGFQRLLVDGEPVSNQGSYAGLPAATTAMDLAPNSAMWVGSFVHCPEPLTVRHAAYLEAMLARDASLAELVRFIRDGGYFRGTVISLDEDSVGYQWTEDAPADDKVSMVFEGCSLTNDTGLAVGDRYPSVVSAGMTHVRMFVNNGIGGQGIAAMAARDVVAYYQPTYLHNVCVPLAGTIELAGATTAADAHTAYGAYCLARRAEGYKVVAVTMPPRNPEAAWLEVKRTEYNGLIRANWTDYADALADVGGDPVIGQADSPSDVAFYRDGLHMTAAGYVIVAGIVRTAIESLL